MAWWLTRRRWWWGWLPILTTFIGCDLFLTGYGGAGRGFGRATYAGTLWLVRLQSILLPFHHAHLLNCNPPLPPFRWRLVGYGGANYATGAGRGQVVVVEPVVPANKADHEWHTPVRVDPTPNASTKLLATVHAWSLQRPAAPSAALAGSAAPGPSALPPYA